MEEIGGFDIRQVASISNLSPTSDEIINNNKKIGRPRAETDHKGLHPDLVIFMYVYV